MAAVRGPRRWSVAATAVLIVAGVYGAGHAVGRIGEPTAVPVAPVSPTPSGGTGGGGDVGATAPPPPSPDRAGAGGWALPLPPTGAGPFGSHRDTGEAFVALTFDDGPDPQWTPEVLSLLRRYGVRATFCVLGSKAAAYPDLIREIVADGHTLCNHSWDHDMDLGYRPPREIERDLARTNSAILAAAPDARIVYYRQPGGRWTARVVEVAQELGMSSLHWTVDPQDWRRPSPATITSTVSTAVYPGAIVLLHDGGGDRRGTVRALRSLLPDLLDRMPLDALPVEPGGSGDIDPAAAEAGDDF